MIIFLIVLARISFSFSSRVKNISRMPSMLKAINFCGERATSKIYAENNPSLCSSESVVRILSHVLKSLEKFGKGMVGPASNALLMTSFLSGSDNEKNSIILFFNIGFLRKSGRLAKLTMMFPAKFSPTIDLKEFLLNIKSCKNTLA